MRHEAALSMLKQAARELAPQSLHMPAAFRPKMVVGDYESQCAGVRMKARGEREWIRAQSPLRQQPSTKLRESSPTSHHVRCKFHGCIGQALSFLISGSFLSLSRLIISSLCLMPRDESTLKMGVDCIMSGEQMSLRSWHCKAANTLFLHFSRSCEQLYLWASVDVGSREEFRWRTLTQYPSTSVPDEIGTSRMTSHAADNGTSGLHMLKTYSISRSATR